jgi:hypothetical protein
MLERETKPTVGEKMKSKKKRVANKASHEYVVPEAECSPHPSSLLRSCYPLWLLVYNTPPLSHARTPIAPYPLLRSHSRARSEQRGRHDAGHYVAHGAGDARNTKHRLMSSIGVPRLHLGDFEA